MESIREMTEAFRNGELDGDKVADLLQRLREDDASIDEFVLECLLDEELRQCLSDPGQIDPVDLEELKAVPVSLEDRQSRTVQTFFTRRATLSILASGLVMAVMLFSLAMWKVPQWRPAMMRSKPTIVAKIAATQDATWDKSSDGDFNKRGLIVGDRLVLNSGSAFIAYGTGALVVLEGPASYTIGGANGGQLQHGKLVARIHAKEAVGFAVDIPGARIVDLGTEFGVDVANGKAEVAVLTGEVELVGKANGSGTRHRLVANESASIDAVNGKIVRRANGDGQLLTAMRLRLERLGQPLPGRRVLAHYGLEKTMAPDTVATGLTASRISMDIGGISSMAAPEGRHSRYIWSEDTGSENPPTVSDIKATWTLTPTAGTQVVLEPTDSVTWKLVTHSHGPFVFHSKLFVSSDPDFSSILAESDVFTVTRHKGGRISQVVAAKLDAALTSSRPLYFGLAFTDDDDSRSNGRFDAIYVNGSISAASN